MVIYLLKNRGEVNGIKVTNINVAKLLNASKIEYVQVKVILMYLKFFLFQYEILKKNFN